jgi:hypothetical protein
MNDREIKKFLTDLDIGNVSPKQKAAAERHAERISDWLQTPDGRRFLFGRVAADTLRKARPDWLEHAEAFASAFSHECGGLPEDKQVYLVRLLMDFAYRGFSSIAAEVASGPREAGVLLAEEGRAKIKAKTGGEVDERRKWVCAKYKTIRRKHKAGVRGDKAARDEVAHEYYKAFGWLDRSKGKRLLHDAAIKRCLQKRNKNKGSRS